MEQINVKKLSRSSSKAEMMNLIISKRNYFERSLKTAKKLDSSGFEIDKKGSKFSSTMN